ncbi:uncharacterized protein [Panulirus ornatus]|uniref:uncharacterized protein isoform X2 n=1 Tax=Panulirus ornatus TaxID=150431 RepID=UPI003A8BEB49
MFQHAVFMVCLLSITVASFYPPDCPATCECEGLTIKCDSGVIPSLDKRLTSFEIQGASPPITALTTAIAEKLDHLVYLQLNSIGLTEVQPGALGVIERLESLKIINNNISVLNPGIFTNCSKLAYLSLENNNIHVDLKNLIELCLGGPSFTLSDKLVNQNKFPVLGSLQLRGNSQTPIMMNEKSQRNIQAMTAQSLHTLELSSCRLTSLRIFNQVNSKLQNLKASDISIMIRSMAAKFELPAIEIFDISNSPFLAQLFLNSPSLNTLPGLKILKMSNCNINVFPQNFLQYKTPNLNQLDLSNNPLDCTCYEASWIPNYVRQGKIILLHEESTTCATPPHLENIPLLTASLCPISMTIPYVTITKPTVKITAATNKAITPKLSTNKPNSATSPTTETNLSSAVPGKNLDTSTKATGESTGQQSSSPHNSLNDTTPNINKRQNEPKSHVWVIIIAVIGTSILIVLVTMFLCLLLHCYRSGLLNIQHNSNEEENQEPMVNMRKSQGQLIIKSE